MGLSHGAKGPYVTLSISCAKPIPPFLLSLESNRGHKQQRVVSNCSGRLEEEEGLEVKQGKERALG